MSRIACFVAGLYALATLSPAGASTGPTASGGNKQVEQGPAAEAKPDLTCWQQEQQVLHPQAGVVRTKQWHQTYAVTGDLVLHLDNKYGRVEIITWEQPEAEVTVEMRAEADNEARAAELLDVVQIADSQLGPLVKVETQMRAVPVGAWQSADRAFRINYRVRVPAGVGLHITNSFGDVALLGARTGCANVAVSYGNVRCERLEGPANGVKINFGCGESVLNYVRQCVLDVTYSKVRLAEAGDLELRSSYADVIVGQVDNLAIHSKHGDVTLGTVRNLIGSGGFSRIVVGRLDQELDMTVRYCDQFAVRSTAKSFRSINLEGGYSSINLNFDPESHFSFDVRTPNGQFFVDKKQTAFTRNEATLGEHRGLFGSPIVAPVANVNVNASYGTVRINK